MKREVHGDRPHPEIAASLHSIGTVLLDQGDLAAARSKFEESLAMQRELHGDRPHPDIASSLNNISSVLEQQGDLAAARSKFQAVLEVRRQLHGDHHSETQRVRAAVERLESTVAPEAGIHPK